MSAPPYHDPTPRDASWWPKGYRRPKDASAWLMQAVWALGGVLGGLWLASDGLPLHAILVAAVGLFSVVWIEFEARCEDRSKVAWVFGGIMALLAVQAIRNHNRSHQE